jgi:4-amino-4-deoxy-L-arabinose transferase-like glycosyltransferase
MRAKRLAVLAVVVVFGLPLFLGLGRIDLRNDEAIYSYAVDSVLEKDTWLTPEISPDTAGQGDPHEWEPAPFLEKPPLKFWIVAAPIKLGLLPHNEFGLRFWDALFGALAFVYVFLIGRRLVDSVCGFGAVYLLSIQYWFVFRHGLRANVMEAALVLAYCAGIYHFLLWSESKSVSKRWLHILLFAGWFTLGFLTKFVAVIFLPMIIGLAALASTDWRRRMWTDKWRWLAGAGVAGVLIAPWFVFEHFRHGETFWQIIFGRHVYERMVDSLDPGHVQPVTYYLTELMLEMRNADTQTWLLVGIAAWIVATIRRRWSGGALVLIWFFLPVGLISLSISKIFHYAFPFLPAVALMAAYPLSLLVRMVRGVPTGFDYLDALAAWPSRRGWPDSLSRFFARNGVRMALLVIATAATVVGIGTLFTGQLEITAFGVRLFRNSSVVRPLLIAVLCALPLLSARLGVLMPGLALVFFLFPIQRYEVTYERALIIDSPMRAVRDCVVEQYEEIQANSSGLSEESGLSEAGGSGGVSGARSKLYVHLPVGVGLTHNYYYYFRRLDVWERPSAPTDQHLYSRLFASGEQAPTIILEPDYLGFLERTNTLDAGDLPPTLMLGIGYDGITEALVVLPGPFAHCADAGREQGGVEYEPRLARLP